MMRSAGKVGNAKVEHRSLNLGIALQVGTRAELSGVQKPGKVTLDGRSQCGFAEPLDFRHGIEAHDLAHDLRRVDGAKTADFHVSDELVENGGG